MSYTYNRGFLTAVPGYAPSLTYFRNGALEKVQHENGSLDEVTIAGHWMPRPQSMTSTPVSGDPWVSGAFVYDAAGNIQSIGPDQYYYDEVSRLVQAEVYLGGRQATEHYTYDRFGNLTSMATQGLGSTTFDTVTWNVDPLTNRLIPAAGEFAHDAAGNLTTSGAGTGAFGAFNMMTSLSGPGRNERYLYTPQDERIATIGHLASPPSFEWTLRGLDQKVLTTYESELATFEPDPVNPGNPVQEHQGWSWQKDYVYRGSSLLAAEVTDNVGGENREHFHLDHLGTPRLKTDGNGTVLASHKYLPYGEELTNPDLDNEVMQFTAHERDRDPSGFGNDLDYMHARYYSPRLGRFLSVDEVLGREAEPQSWNRYSYARNSPILRLAPDGRQDMSYAYYYHSKAALDQDIDGQTHLQNLGEASAVGGVTMAMAVAPLPGPEDVVIGLVLKALKPLAGPVKGFGGFLRRLFKKADEGTDLTQARRTVPNPHGSRGGPEHQAKIQQRIEDLEAEGHAHLQGGSKPEEVVPTPTGSKGSRHPDITTRRPDGTVYRENVGRSTQSGDPVARERRALDDLEAATGERPGYTAYDQQR